MMAINWRGREGDGLGLRMRFGQVVSRAGSAAALVMVCATANMRAQDAAAGGGGRVKLAEAMVADAGPDWEVTTVKPSDPNETKDYMYMQGRHLVVHNEPVENMLRLAYSVQNSQIVGAPEWVKTERWDVGGVPNVDGQMNAQQLQGMLQKVLEGRFGLRLHREQREMPVFALTVAKGGPKLMTKSADDSNGGPKRKVDVGSGQIGNEFANTSMPDLALMLLLQVDRPIVDQTGLQGRYDFRLQWTMDEAQARAPDAPPGIFTAIQEQIGLKLEPVKAKADVLVIDKVERPGAN